MAKTQTAAPPRALTCECDVDSSQADLQPHMGVDPLGAKGFVCCIGADLAHGPLGTEIHSWVWVLDMWELREVGV